MLTSALLIGVAVGLVAFGLVMLIADPKEKTMVEQNLLGVWVAPILLIPGFALLTISTGNRVNQALNATVMFGSSCKRSRVPDDSGRSEGEWLRVR